MSPAPPEGWVRVLVRPAFKSDVRDVMDRLGGEWNPSLGAWVVEPTPGRRLNRETRQWEPFMEFSDRFRVELAVRDLRGQFTVEWQTSGPSLLPQRREDVRPTARTNRGWSTPKWEDLR